MPIINRLLARIRGLKKRPLKLARNRVEPLQIEALIQAHGDWLALLATIMERERIVSGGELARSLTDFAELTAHDRPAEGQILLFWASRLQDTAVTLCDFPSVH